MCSCNHKMFAQYLFRFCLVSVLLPILLSANPVNNVYSKHKPSKSDVKKINEGNTDNIKRIPDQIALTTTRTKLFQYTPIRKYEEGHLNNLPSSIKQNVSKYSDNYKIDQFSLDETKTAEEYVAKAIGLYGTRLHEPIQVPSEINQLFDLPQREIKSQLQNDIKYDYINTQRQLLVPHQMFVQNSEDYRNQQNKSYKEAINAQISNNEEIKSENDFPNNIHREPAPVYEKESSQTYDEFRNVTYNNPEAVKRLYHTKNFYKPKESEYAEFTDPDSDENERVSSLSDITKAEIMKQIEKSVLKYMKELEAEGKMITASKDRKLYKFITTPSKVQQLSSVGLRPKYTTPRQYPANTAAVNANYQPHMHDHSLNLATEQPYQTDSESSYQEPTMQSHDVLDSITPNVEFIYKIKTRAPIKTASVKTISKPYVLPLKASYEPFDHSAAIKNMEDFDLSHVITAKESDEMHKNINSSTSKLNKLYINSNTYKDINSLPYKYEKSRPSHSAPKKLTGNEMNAQFKGYSGYFAEPISDNENEHTELSDGYSENAYPMMNLYQYILKKEKPATTYKTSSSVSLWEQMNAHNKHKFSVGAGQINSDYDSHNPKFNNNNPDYSEYQHASNDDNNARDQHHNSHKHEHHTNGKRGKRGYANGSRKPIKFFLKDFDANLALRPPPAKATITYS